MIRKLLIIFLFFSISFQISSAETPHPVTVMLNNYNIVYDVQPKIVKGRTMVPLRATFEAFGIEVGWNNDTKTITGATGD